MGQRTRAGHVIYKSQRSAGTALQAPKICQAVQCAVRRRGEAGAARRLPIYRAFKIREFVVLRSLEPVHNDNDVAVWGNLLQQLAKHAIRAGALAYCVF